MCKVRDQSVMAAIVAQLRSELTFLLLVTSNKNSTELPPPSPTHQHSGVNLQFTDHTKWLQTQLVIGEFAEKSAFHKNAVRKDVAMCNFQTFYIIVTKVTGAEILIFLRQS